jgi:coatomer subunit gamma
MFRIHFSFLISHFSFLISHFSISPLSISSLSISPQAHLRRLVYLTIKELNVDSNESLIVVSSLNRDMTGNVDLFRANAIRVLGTIIDPQMLSQIDRLMKQAIVDKNSHVVSAVLVAGIKMFDPAAEVIKRWVSEVSSALNSKNKMVQYHALQLLHSIRQRDRLAVSKIVTGLTRSPPKGPLAQCLLIRYIASLLAFQNPPDRDLLKYLVDSLHNKNFTVMYEAARVICRLPNLGPAQVSPAVTVLQEFLPSPVPVQRFAAVRTLSQVVGRFPQLVQPAQIDLEHLISDQNRSIATLAITTLLKTGVESNVDHWMKSISGFMSEISDEYKIVLVDAIKTLNLKFPHKHKSLMGFMATALREEGGATYKKALVNAMLEVIEHVDDAKEDGLEHFCEFIEDCEFPELSVKILHLLGAEGPKTSTPARYIRFIFNRVILETASVRSAAVSSLAQFGLQVPSLRDSIVVLLQRSLNDGDDEVRDRAVYYLEMLKRESKEVELLAPVLPAPVRDLEVSLQTYLARQDHNAGFDLDTDLVEAEDEEEPEDADNQQGQDDNKASSMLGSASIQIVNPYLEVLSSIDEFKELGPLFASRPAVQLTEEESEYPVQCVKHIYLNHVVFQFNVTNNMEDQQLENITVDMEPDDDEWALDMAISETVLKHKADGSCFVVLQRPDGAYASGAIQNELKFDFRDADPVSGEVAEDLDEDSYELEEIQVYERDFMKPGKPMGLLEFKKQWEALAGTEQIKKYSLGLDDLQGAVDAVIDLLGMQPCENSGTVPDEKRAHACNLFGMFLGGRRVLCRAGFVLDKKNGVTLKIAVRCQESDVAEMLVNCIR